MFEKILSALDYSEISNFISSIDSKFMPIIGIPVFSAIYNYIILPLAFDPCYKSFNPQYVAEMDFLVNHQLPQLENFKLEIIDELSRLGIEVNLGDPEVMFGAARELQVLDDLDSSEWSDATSQLEGIGDFGPDPFKLQVQIESINAQASDIRQQINRLENNKNGTYYACQVVGIGLTIIGGLVTGAVVKGMSFN